MLYTSSSPGKGPDPEAATKYRRHLNRAILLSFPDSSERILEAKADRIFLKLSHIHINVSIVLNIFYTEIIFLIPKSMSLTLICSTSVLAKP